MEARLIRAAFLTGLVASLGAGHRTTNFIVSAPTKDVARQVGDLAEQYRRDLALEWLGEPIPAWGQPCPITVEVGPQLGAGGATSFVFDRGQVFGWQMTIQGPLDRLLDSVLPHEVTHTIFASHFRQPLPRWADEGACSTVEHRSERIKQQKMLVRFLQSQRGIAFDDMFRMKDYPRDILPLYAQGHSLATYLVAQGGKKKFVQFVGEGLQSREWRRALHAHYGFADLGALQNNWLEWVKQGSPLPVKADQDEILVAHAGNQTLASLGPAPRAGSDANHQLVSHDQPAGKLVPVHRPEDAFASDSSETGWRRVGEEARRLAAGAAEMSSLASSEEEPGAVVSQATRPQAPQPAQQIILEWNQPPRAALGAAPAEKAATAPQPSRGSVYEGRAKQQVLRR
ncbi:MAG TPA: hypothetical protein VGN42_09090 [Pirellulales bacterium]|jgi:hypothetical protein|nr:hypothetical protein [Pirellulales bacterium]